MMKFSKQDIGEKLSSGYDPTSDGTTHIEATSMFEKLFNHLERQDDSSPSELLLMKRLQDWFARKRTSAVKPKNITNFFKNT